MRWYTFLCYDARVVLKDRHDGSWSLDLMAPGGDALSVVLNEKALIALREAAAEEEERPC